MTGAFRAPRAFLFFSSMTSSNRWAPAGHVILQQDSDAVELFLLGSGSQGSISNWLPRQSGIGLSNSPLTITIVSCARSKHLFEVANGRCKTRIEIDFRRPSELFLGPADVRSALKGIVARQRCLGELGAGSREFDYLFRERLDGELVGIAEVTGPVNGSREFMSRTKPSTRSST